MISAEEITEMVKHWLNTPVNSYLGSSYGFDKYAVLFQPLSMAGADEMIAKLKRDVPVLMLLPSSAINLFSIPVAKDKQMIFLSVGDVQFNLSEMG